MLSIFKARSLVFLVWLALGAGAWAGGQSGDSRTLTVEDILKWPPVPADRRVAYGSGPLQFGELRLPNGPGPHPVAVVVHGGCWLARYNIDHIGPLCAALARAGVATWSLEYRRVGNPGGGWPGTFEDIARGTDHLRALAHTYPLDLNRVVAVGHSAGGHLALWAAARRRLAKESPFFSPDPLPLRGVVSLAGVTDLRKSRAACGEVVNQLVGAPPEDMNTTRYAQASPIELLPVGLPQRLIHGTRDAAVPLDMSREYEDAARKKGDDVKLTVIDGAGHFELIAPQSPAWRVVEDTVLSLLSVEKAKGPMK